MMWECVNNVLEYAGFYSPTCFVCVMCSTFWIIPLLKIQRALSYFILHLEKIFQQTLSKTL